MNSNWIGQFARLSLAHKKYVSINEWIIKVVIAQSKWLLRGKMRLSIKPSTSDGIIGQSDDSIEWFCARQDSGHESIEIMVNNRLWKSHFSPPIEDNRTSAENSVKNYIIRNNCITSAHTEIGFRFSLPFLLLKRSFRCCLSAANSDRLA